MTPVPPSATDFEEFHGSLELATRLSVESPWTPTVYCNWKNFDCSTYYCHFAEYLLNSDYVLLPFGAVVREISQIALEDWNAEAAARCGPVRPHRGGRIT